MGKFRESRLRKGISIVASVVLLLSSIMPTVPVFGYTKGELDVACNVNADVCYTTLQAAITAAAEDGEEVVVLEDIDEHISINNKNLTLNLNGKTINPSTAGTVIDINNSTVTITGDGTVKNSNDGSYLTVAAHEGADVTIMNGTYESVSLGNTALIYAYNGARITIKDGTFKGAKAINPGDKDGKVIYAGASDNVAAERDNYGYMVIEGGSFEGRMSDSNWGHYSISGGTFDRNEVAHYEDDANGDSQNTHTTITLAAAGMLADGHEAVESAGKWTVQEIVPEYVAQIGDDKYETLQGAINEAGANAEVELLNDITSEHISITNKNLTLNLSGKTINPSTAGTVIDINNSTVTITGEGTVKNSNDGSYLTVAAHEGADVTIMNGTYESVSLGNTALIYAYNGATITIKDGTFKGAKATNPEDKDGKVIYAGASDNVAAERDNYGYLVIEGGSFEGRMSDSNWGHYEIKGGTFDRNEVAHYEDDVNGDSQNTHTTITLAEAGFLADGYEAVENAGKWTVGCGPEVDTTEYPLEACPEGGVCEESAGYEQDGNTCTAVTGYKLSSCTSGYTLEGDACVINSGEDVEELVVLDPGTTASAGGIDDISLDNAEATTGFDDNDYSGVNTPQIIIQQKTDEDALGEEGTTESALETDLTSDFVTDTGKVVEMQGILDIKLYYLDGSGNSTLLSGVQFSDPVKIMIPVAASVSAVEVRADHGDGYGTTGLTLDSTAGCSGGVPTLNAYTGGDVLVVNGKAEIYTCSASSFVAYTETDKQSSTPSNKTSGGGGGGGSSKTTKADDAKSTTGDNAKLDETKADGNNEENVETKADETNGENVDKPTMTEAQAVEKFGQEQIDAYKWALENGITTMKTVEAARLDEPLTRAELAKMMVVYIQKVLGKSPVVTGDVNYSDVKVEEIGDLVDYVKLAYQYQIMGINADGTPIEYFNPHGIVSRGEYATVFSRVLFGAKFNKDGADFYTNHLEALKAAGILTNIIPTIQEMRGWVMLMMYRSSQNGEAIEKVANSTEETADETKADETANEETTTDETKTETNEETKAEETTNAEATTGDTAEAPATEETSETTAENTDTTAEATTGDVAEVNTGAVAEATT